MLKRQLNLDYFISWRQSDKTLTVKWNSGDVAVLTMSPNGHDAQSVYLSKDRQHSIIDCGTWYTIETLGRETEIRFSPDVFVEKIAEKNWRPLPRHKSIIGKY